MLTAPFLDIGDLVEPVVLVESLAVEALRLVKFAPEMRSGNELQRAFARNVIKRDPHADASGCLDAVIGLVVVPGRGCQTVR